MTLTPGSRFGHFDIGPRFGAGGMGEVYRARDTKLNRDVALKILPEAFATDPDRRGSTLSTRWRRLPPMRPRPRRGPGGVARRS